MSTDSVDNVEMQRNLPDWWQLPHIVNMEIRPFVPDVRSYRYIKSVYSEAKEGVEFLIEFEGTFQRSRALSPMLTVGDQPVGEYELLDENHVRFFTYEPEKLEQGAPIFIGWPRMGEYLEETGFVYETGKAT